MAAFRTPVLTGVLSKLCRLSLTSQVTRPSVTCINTVISNRPIQCCSSLHTSVTRHSSSTHKRLMEFFDDEKNWGEFEVKVGRAWKIEELRIKSNEDLHKLWFVLLKEKNMLLTMEHHCREEYRLFPNPERIDKIEESMENLENVVRERNRAYWLLETGEDGERSGTVEIDSFGRKGYRKFAEHLIPYWESSKPWIVKDKSVEKFQRLMREKKYLEKKKAKTRIRNHVCMLLRRFPHLDMDMLQRKYPEVNVRALRLRKYSLGHHEHNLA